MSYDKIVDGAALDADLTSIADAIRSKGNTTEQLAFPAGFVSAIDAISGNTPSPAKGWVRPANWPDLDSLDLSNEDAMYYTVDCRGTIAAHAIDPDVEHEIGFCADTTGGTWTLERGKIEGGAFVVAETCVTGRNSGAVYNTILPITEGDFVVYRMRATGDAEDGKGLKLVETASAVHEQPVVEIYGRLPWASGNAARGWNYREFASRVTEHVKVIFPGTSTIAGLQSMFTSCYSLQSIDMSGWDTTNWAVTSLQYMFNSCYILQALKFGVNTIWPALATQINDASKLRHNSIVAFLGVLPTVATTVTLTLGNANLARISDAEKSVATNKGWTLA